MRKEAQMYSPAEAYPKNLRGKLRLVTPIEEALDRTSGHKKRILVCVWGDHGKNGEWPELEKNEEYSGGICQTHMEEQLAEYRAKKGGI